MDYYSDEPEQKPFAPSEDESPENMPTATIPRSMLMGKDFKPGDEIVLKIDSIHEDEVVVSYAPEKKDDETRSPEESATSMSGSRKDDMAEYMD